MTLERKKLERDTAEKRKSNVDARRAALYGERWRDGCVSFLLIGPTPAIHFSVYRVPFLYIFSYTHSKYIFTFDKKRKEGRNNSKPPEHSIYERKSP